MLLCILFCLLPTGYVSADDSQKFQKAETDIIDWIDYHFDERSISTIIELNLDTGEDLFLAPGVRFTDKGKQYLMIFHLYAYNWFTIEKVDFYVDGNRTFFDSPDEARNVINNNVIKELVTFYTTKTFLEKIASAGSVKLTVIGGDNRRVCELSKEQKGQIRKLNQYPDF
jgi:hypothetical protein